MVGESRNIFTKRVLLEKHINGIMYENPRGATAPLAPSADAPECKWVDNPNKLCTIIVANTLMCHWHKMAREVDVNPIPARMACRPHHFICQIIVALEK